MAKRKLISSGYIIGKVHRDFKPAMKGWHTDALEWIGEALGLLNMTGGMVKTSCVSMVKNFRLKIPCPVESLYGIIYENSKLTLKGSSMMLPEIISNKFPNMGFHPNHHYQVNPNFIHFSFREGEVELYYSSFPTDEEGLPMIPEEHKVLQAISWYVISRLCLRGLKHPVINFLLADEKWEIYSVRAQNAMKQMSVSEREAFSRNWLNVLPDAVRADDFYAETYNQNTLRPNSNINEFLGTTIQH